MIRSHAAGDEEQFWSIAGHIAEEASRKGQAKVAAAIKSAIDKVSPGANAQNSVELIPSLTSRSELVGLVRASYPEVRFSDLVLSSDLERKIDRLVREHRECDVLQGKGLEPRRKFLFSGPPGTGKGMTAQSIARELRLPLFSILLDGVITKYMGETAAKLRLIFDAMHATRGIFFFDEVDALASRRGAENDIGEARRMLNSFLQLLEEDRSKSIIIAATNHRGLLDPAVFRRFDAVCVYQNPSPQEARKILKKQLSQFELHRLDWKMIDECASGLSQADLVAAANDAAREAVLDSLGRIDNNLLRRSLNDRRAIHFD